MRLLYIGKFQPFHKGHLKAIEIIKNISSEILICIGSPQDERYFNLEERINMVSRNAGIDPITIEDLGQEHPLYNDWGRYVLEKMGKVDIVASGNEYVRDDFMQHKVPILWLPRFDNISGTEVRRRIENKDDSWIDLVTPVSEEIIKLSNFYRRNYNG